MRNFKRFFEEYQQYFVEHPKAKSIPVRYSIGEYHLGRIAYLIRREMIATTEEQRKKLDNIHFFRGRLRVCKRYSFEQIYANALEFVKKNGNVWLPTNFVSHDGMETGKIIGAIRRHTRKVTPMEWKQLEALGIFKPKERITFEKFFDYLLEYQKEKGNLEIRKNYITPSGVKLGYYVSAYRYKKEKLPAWQVKRLDCIGFSWDVYADRMPFEEMLQLFESYFQKYGKGRIKANYITENGIHLGQLYQSVRRGRHSVTEEQRRQLEEIGFAFYKVHQMVPFDVFVQKMEAYHQEYGTYNVPYWYQTEDGMKLGTLVTRFRNHQRKVTPQQQEVLDKMFQIVPKKCSRMSNEVLMEYIEAFYAEYHHCHIPSVCIMPDGVNIAPRVRQIRTHRRKMSDEQLKRLEEMQFDWSMKKYLSFDELYRLLKEYKEENGNLRIEIKSEYKGEKLGYAVQNIRTGQRRLSLEQRRMLDDLGFRWSEKPGKKSKIELTM